MEKLQFPVLKLDGSNYLSWSQNAEIVLNAKGLGDSIIVDQHGDLQTTAQAIFILRHHLDQDLQAQYIDEYNPKSLWDSLKRRYDHMRLITLPAARNEWIHLRVLDHPTIAGYNSALFCITAQLRVCGQVISDADRIEKTLSTFPAANITFAQQYRQMHFTEYSDLISVMLLAEKNDILLMQNAKARPSGTIPKPETMFTSTTKKENAPKWKGRPQGHKEDQIHDLEIIDPSTEDNSIQVREHPGPGPTPGRENRRRQQANASDAVEWGTLSETVGPKTTW